jgi:5'(3')-deoxyribonucleotidase
MIYVFDLDHTLCETNKKSNGDWDYLSAPPYGDRIKKVNKLFEEGHKIIIETARGCNSKKNWYLETFEQLRSWGLKFHELRTGVKFGADYYIDDKAINSEIFFKE